MNRMMLSLLCLVSLGISVDAHAQLISVDGGAAAIDSNGLMWANIVGIDLGWSSAAAVGSAQGWIASLNASNYGGYDDWALATGDGSIAANSTTNELGELFYTDCGNSSGSTTILNNPGKNCSGLSAVTGLINRPVIFFSSSADTALNNPSPLADFFFWTYETSHSSQGPWTKDTQFGTGGGMPLVGLGDAIAVREVPEIDPTFAVNFAMILLGSLTVLCGRRKISDVRLLGPK